MLGEGLLRLDLYLDPIRICILGPGTYTRRRSQPQRGWWERRERLSDSLPSRPQSKQLSLDLLKREIVMLMQRAYEDSFSPSSGRQSQGGEMLVEVPF